MTAPQAPPLTDDVKALKVSLDQVAEMLCDCTGEHDRHCIVFGLHAALAELLAARSRERTIREHIARGLRPSDDRWYRGHDAALLEILDLLAAAPSAERGPLLRDEAQQADLLASIQNAVTVLKDVAMDRKPIRALNREPLALWADYLRNYAKRVRGDALAPSAERGEPQS